MMGREEGIGFSLYGTGKINRMGVVFGVTAGGREINKSCKEGILREEGVGLGLYRGDRLILLQKMKTCPNGEHELKNSLIHPTETA